MIEPIDTYIRRLEKMLEDAEWMGCDSPIVNAQLKAAYAERDKGERYHTNF